jgi:hypothetical protein
MVDYVGMPAQPVSEVRLFEYPLTPFVALEVESVEGVLQGS